MSDLVVETIGLTKRYGDLVAVDSLDLSVQRGEVFGLLGPNGAGKTTTILMLLGLTEPSEGTVRVLGLDPVLQPLSVKARTGYMPEQIGFYEDLTARQNLFYIARLNGLNREEAYRRIDEVLERVGLENVRDHPVATFSRGMRQRLGVADVLLKRPQLVILDEPTQGLDPEVARRFLQIVLDLKAEGVTVLLCSHLLHQVQAVCDRVGLFHRGRMVLEGSVPELARQVLGSAFRIQVEAEGPAATLVAALRHMPDAAEVEREEDDNRYLVIAQRDIRAEAAEAVVKAGGRLLGLEVEMPSLDDIYARYFQEVEHVAAH